jgi:hypothetical protein
MGSTLTPTTSKPQPSLLSKFNVGKNWSVDTANLLWLDPQPYDVVYSWGVLHHTGEMWRALQSVTTFVRPGGLLAVAIYRRTPACAFWKREKKFYSSAPTPVRLLIRSLYKTAYRSAIAASGRNPFDYVFNYHNRTRGMSFHHDIHDWLGGYPYESASPDELAAFMAQHGLSIERSFQRLAAVMGFFGSHCDEFVARRKPS